MMPNKLYKIIWPRAALIAQLFKAQLRRPQLFWSGFKSRPAEWVFKLPFSPLLSYLGDCDVLNAQTCNDPRQRWGNNLGRGGGSPPASQLADLFWVSCHRCDGPKCQFRNIRPTNNRKKARTKKIEKHERKNSKTVSLYISLIQKCVPKIWIATFRIHSARISFFSFFLTNKKGKSHFKTRSEPGQSYRSTTKTYTCVME